MERTDFEQQISALVPRPDPEATAALFALGQALEDESELDGTRDLFNSLSFISRHFNAEITQEAYEIIRYGEALPGEMLAAAFHMAACPDCTPQQMAKAAEHGKLMCFHWPKDAAELSPLAVCTVKEKGKSLTCHTMEFGSFDPDTALQSALRYAHDRQISVTDALLSMTTAMKPDPDGRSRKLLVDSNEKMTQVLNACFGHYPAVAARLTFDADRSQVSVEYNPLWLELSQRQEPAQGGIAQTM
ncbi:hypothetical protein D1646_04020 [Pseudoflavonifractor sp. 60]|uniref:hypothetical protein n=1 Tax=Pseudoflavonifractor sp. 60 TaxID=2304576 RepID=UPI00136BCC7E|nr:hypothetical protein [Pseudoflavonifractor sp. 60]NBI65990.1 hypothetical protein [Pseudoflavonifractor sp. 60]